MIEEAKGAYFADFLNRLRHLWNRETILGVGVDRLPNDTVALFDFDGTLTTRDTFRDILIWRFGKIKVFAMLGATLPFIMLYALGPVSNDLPKALIFRTFFRGWLTQDFANLCNTYARDRLPALIRSRALERVQWHQKQGHMVVIVSASLKDWIEPWAQTMNIKHVLAVRAAHVDGHLTGSFDGPCIHGRQKAEAIRRFGINKETHTLYAYGDTRGDQEMLDISDYPAFRSFQ